jgi:hypothetical protein
VCLGRRQAAGHKIKWYNCPQVWIEPQPILPIVNVESKGYWPIGGKAAQAAPSHMPDEAALNVRTAFSCAATRPRFREICLNVDQQCPADPWRRVNRCCSLGGRMSCSSFPVTEADSRTTFRAKPEENPVDDATPSKLSAQAICGTTCIPVRHAHKWILFALGWGAWQQSPAYCKRKGTTLELSITAIDATGFRRDFGYIGRGVQRLIWRSFW